MFRVFLLLFAAQFDTTFRDGLIALNRNELPAAKSRLEAAAELQPHDGRVWLALAQTYWKLHDSARAEAAAHTAETWSGGDPILLHSLALFYSEAGYYPAAVNSLAAAIKKKPFDESYYFELAQLHLRHENFAAALDAADAGRRKFDKSAQLALAAGVADYGLRRFPEAIDAFLRTIELDSSVEQPYVFLGRMADQAEDRLPRIASAFSALAKRQPESWLGNFLYGKVLALANEPAAAEPLLRKSISLNNGYWESHFELGVLLAGKRKFDDALREFLRSAELNPREPAPHYHLARLYERMGKRAEAGAERDLHARLTEAARPAAGMAGTIK